MRNHPIEVRPPNWRIPFNAYGNAGPVLHFAHANGYPPRAYRQLLAELGRAARVNAMHQRPLWPWADPASLHDWRALAQDLASFLEQQSLGPVLGVGHSLGASVTLRLALQQPERFSLLVLIDPVLFTSGKSLGWQLTAVMGLGMKVHPLAAATLRRRRCFETRQAMFDNYRAKEVFSRLDDEQLWNYVDALARPNSDGSLGLAYSPEWETQVYLTGAIGDREIWRGLKTCRLPILLLRGAESQVCPMQTAERIRCAAPQTQIVSIPGAGHLVALEKPGEIAQAIFQFTGLEPQNDNL